MAPSEGEVESNENTTASVNETITDSEASHNSTEMLNQEASENMKASVKEIKPKKTLKKYKSSCFQATGGISTRSVLRVSEPVYTQPSMTTEQLRKSRAVLRKYLKGEALKKTTEEAKNTLETYVVESQNKVHESSEVQEVRFPTRFNLRQRLSRSRLRNKERSF